MNFKRHRTLAIALMAALSVAAPNACALAATITSTVGEEDVLQAYSTAAKQSNQVLQVVTSPADVALAATRKQAEDAERTQEQPALLDRNKTLAPFYAKSETAKKKAFAEESAAEPQIEKQYDAAIDAAEETKRVAIEQAQSLYAERKKQLTESMASLKKNIGTDSDAPRILAASTAALNADLETVIAKAKSLVAKAEEECKRTEYEADIAKNDALGHIRAVAQNSLQPTADALAVAEAEASEKLHTALKPLEDAEHNAIAQAQTNHDQTIASAQAQYDAAFAKRVNIWIDYKWGRISAAAAVAQLSDLANRVGK